jgi:hypothetical protein
MPVPFRKVKAELSAGIVAGLAKFTAQYIAFTLQAGTRTPDLDIFKIMASFWPASPGNDLIPAPAAQTILAKPTTPRGVPVRAVLTVSSVRIYLTVRKSLTDGGPP